MATDTPADGHTRALSLSTIAFTACFAVWTIFSIIGIQIKAELGLSDRPCRVEDAIRKLESALRCA